MKKGGVGEHRFDFQHLGPHYRNLNLKSFLSLKDDILFENCICYTKKGFFLCLKLMMGQALRKCFCNKAPAWELYSRCLCSETAAFNIKHYLSLSILKSSHHNTDGLQYVLISDRKTSHQNGGLDLAMTGSL